MKDDVAELRSDVRTMLVDVATLKERVAHLPSKGFIVTTIVTASALLTAAVTFADKLRALFAG